jgi:predicted transcriptional regulator
MSLLLVDCVRAVVMEGSPVSAHQVARRLGADVFRCDDILRDLAKEGLIFGRVQHVASKRSGVRPRWIYIPAEKVAKRRMRDIDAPHVPLPGQQTFPVF